MCMFLGMQHKLSKPQLPNILYKWFVLDNLLFSIEVELIYNVVLVSGVQQSDSVIYTYISFFSDSFPL